ncbi:hydrogenase small subunit [uncultured Thiodictyon sp.]|jgi:hydrogenase small subunit|uniref:hydrogenase small subunit n=1 Tax=uncultured Thiodictyon sp. TaxID=1846217 RepID=UPI0025EEC6A3|nr:hydrogenase small subunit [uncultured Thiodictyon sp.]
MNLRSLTSAPRSGAQPGADQDSLMLDDATADRLLELGISRRRFLSYCAGLASLMALPQSMVPSLAAAATARTRPSVVYLSFQECTGCLESMVNSFPFQGGGTIENLILNLVSLDFQQTLMAASGEQAEEQLRSATNRSGHVLVIDGSIPAQGNRGYFVSGEKNGVVRFREAAENARLIIAAGTCASFGGLPKADPNPTGAVSVGTLLRQLGIKKDLINVPGCPPIPEVLTGVILYYLARGKPALDALNRPMMFYGRTVHDGCYREESFEDGPHARSFDDAHARAGGCLIKLGCKGPVTHSACARIGWNQGTSFPMMSGHGCIGCTEPDFWDRVNTGGTKGFYVPLGHDRSARGPIADGPAQRGRTGGNGGHGHEDDEDDEDDDD